jgi:hypothetical protein
MNCKNCNEKLNIRDQGIIKCGSCGTDNVVKIGELFTNVPEFKLNSYIMLCAFLAGGVGAYSVWPQETNAGFLSSFIMFLALAQIIIAVRSGYFSTRVGVFFKQFKPTGYYACFVFYILLFLMFGFSFVGQLNA